MNRPFSLYLDLVRFTAACLVYVYHSNQRWLVTDVLPASNYGHSSVIVFFVLSGFVIAHVTHRKESHWIDYAASRFSRVFSVAVPAVALTLMLDGIGRQLNPELYTYPFDQLAVRLGASLMLMNEWWFVSITSLSNVPYWSICYEFWYYVAFGLVTFLPGRTGLAAMALLALFLGPKIVLLAPLWWAGVLLYRWPRLQRLSLPVAWAMVLASVAGIVAFSIYDVTGLVAKQFEAFLGKSRFTELTFSKFFASDYLLGLLVFLNFAGMRRVSESLAPLLLAIERPVRFAAQYTFTLYLLHQPLFLFWGSAWQGDPATSAFWWRTTALVAASVLLVGRFTEGQRHMLRQWVVQQLQRLSGMQWVRLRAADR